ncbi:MAG: molybdopterin converting factor subunit 1 [Gammaproteobacteria bacterium]|nr:MAG: molybdopterin converting factor subunit 1 [Gammaproteobacteria bacterium]RKZ75769.1 MAG: molybdopterin converting factor subunit 1 [Gammaproteobacteria bacterium]
MTITVKFFASLREQVGKSEVQIESSDSLTVEQVWTKVCDNAPLPVHILMAVNKEYSKPDVLVQAGDEVAFFPPVTGG